MRKSVHQILVEKYGQDYEQLIQARKLETIYLHNNQINDLTPLQNLTGLKTLFLGHNQISDLTPLQNLTELEWLGLYNNQISDLTPLQNLTNLKWLNLGRNRISDLAPLQNLMELQTLNLDNNQISDLTPLQNLTNLKQLTLWHNQIKIGPKNLKELKLLQRVKRYYWEAWLRVRLLRYHYWVHEMEKFYLVEALYEKPRAYFRLKGIPLISE